MMSWMYDNATRIANANKENAVVVAFLYELFDHYEGGFNSLLDYASQGYGYNMIVFSNFILNDLEFGQKSDGVQFFYNGDFDALVSYNGYLDIIKEVAYAYVDFYEHEQRSIISKLKKMEKFFSDNYLLNKDVNNLEIRIPCEHLCPISGFWCLNRSQENRKYFEYETFLPKVESKEDMWYYQIPP